MKRERVKRRILINVESAVTPRMVGKSGEGPMGGSVGGGITVSRPKRSYGSVSLDSERGGSDAAQIANEAIVHLAGLVGANVRVTMEIDAEVPTGVPEHVVRIVMENGKTLKFEPQGFEDKWGRVRRVPCPFDSGTRRRHTAFS